jgi:hypothetical protein
MVKWKSLAQNITYSYDAIESNNNVTVKITFSNFVKGLYIKDTKSDKNYYYNNSSELTLSGYKPNNSYRFEIYTNDQYCKFNLLYTLYVVVPWYNQFQHDEICEGIEEYTLCQKWINNQYSYEDWKKKVQAYKDSLIANDEENIQNERETSILEKIIDVYGNIYFIVLPIIIIVGGATIYVYNKKHDLF